jgi:hypothetical protein
MYTRGWVHLPGGEAVMLFHILNNPMFLLELSLLLNIEALDCGPMVIPETFIDPVSLADDKAHGVMPSREEVSKCKVKQRGGWIPEHIMNRSAVSRPLLSTMHAASCEHSPTTNQSKPARPDSTICCRVLPKVATVRLINSAESAPPRVWGPTKQNLRNRQANFTKAVICPHSCRLE